MAEQADQRDRFFTYWLRHEADLRAFVGSLVRQSHAREDVLQEVASTIWSRFDEYDANRSFGAWARGIAARKILEQVHQDERFPAAFAPETIQAIADAFDRTEALAPVRYDALRHCLERLPDHARHLLTLRYDRELSGEEIARQTDRSLDAVYQSLSRIRHRLEDCIRRRLAQEE